MISDKKNAKRSRKIIFAGFTALYLILTIYNLSRNSKWYVDNLISIGFIASAYFASRWFHLGRKEYLFFNIAVLVHNFGTFGFYSFVWENIGIAYDNIVHLVGGIAGSLIFANFVVRKFKIGNPRKHKLLIMLLAVSLTVAFGMVVELTEFFGVMHFGVEIAGDGILYVGPVENERAVGASKEYADTLTDTISNLVGAAAGGFIYLVFGFSKK